MATVHRTFINRGKKEVTELKPNYTYAVEYTLDTDTARMLGVRTEQVGLITVNHYGKIASSYNIAQLWAWVDGEIKLEGKHVWYASDMERDFANLHNAYDSLWVRDKNVRENLAHQMRKVHYYEEHPLHQLAESCIELWNKIFKKRHE